MKLLVTDTNEWVSHPFTFLTIVKQAGYTDVVVNVWHGKGAKWFSSLPWDPTVMKPYYDPAGTLLSLAKELRLTIWASFTLGVQQLPTLHPEWTYQQATQWTRPFDWTRDEFRSWIVEVVADFYRTHPSTPGLFLDYARFWDGTYGPLAGDSAGRVEVVTDGVRRIVGAVRAINPAVISMSFSNVDRLYEMHRAQGNDGRLWLQHGLIQHANCPAYDVDPRVRLVNIAADTADLPAGSVIASIATYGTNLAPRTPGALLMYTESQLSLFPHLSHYFSPTLSSQAVNCLGVVNT